jgi:hypothetical protein
MLTNIVFAFEKWLSSRTFGAAAIFVSTRRRESRQRSQSGGKVEQLYRDSLKGFSRL